jgi:hemerythrin
MLWRDKYELGIPLIDSQHRELFRRVDTFFQTVRTTVPWDQKVERVNETLEFMKAYVVEHFKDEEAYQLEVGYPSYEAHRQKHQDMVRYVLDFSEEYEVKGCDEQLMLNFAGKLLSWLINHVAAEDQRIAAYALSKGGADDGR